MTRVFRLCSSRFPANRGTGAALFGGRWNRIGSEVIYAAESASLAALEILVHYSVLPTDFSLTQITIPDSLAIATLNPARLPAGWDDEVPSVATQTLGEEWIMNGEQAVLRVPSSIVPTDFNYVINPVHPLFFQIAFSPQVPFRFDPRLK